MLRNQIVNCRPNCYSNKNVWCNFLHGGYHLILCIIHSVSYRQLLGFNLHLIFHMKFLNQSASNDRHNQSYYHICKCNFATEHTHKQNQ